MISLDVEPGVVDDRKEDYCGSDEGAGAGSRVAREGDGSDALHRGGNDRIGGLRHGVWHFTLTAFGAAEERSFQRSSDLDTERPPHLARARRRSGFEGGGRVRAEGGAGPGP